jgi:hypothetical protein
MAAAHEASEPTHAAETTPREPAARSYWEAYGPDAPAAGDPPLPPPAIPFGFTTFPEENWRTPLSWVEANYPNVVYFNEADQADTSPPGRSRKSSAGRCGPPSGRSADGLLGP